ncbi:hypothetical protein HK102_001332 [Quaeritorhiza haematococci]|nr:hypothetical protein HK102_001332 [Quaeritorhiza haematococci]
MSSPDNPSAGPTVAVVAGFPAGGVPTGRPVGAAPAPAPTAAPVPNGGDVTVVDLTGVQQQAFFSSSLAAPTATATSTLMVGATAVNSSSVIPQIGMVVGIIFATIFGVLLLISSLFICKIRARRRRRMAAESMGRSFHPNMDPADVANYETKRIMSTFRFVKLQEKDEEKASMPSLMRSVEMPQPAKSQQSYLPTHVIRWPDGTITFEASAPAPPRRSNSTSSSTSSASSSSSRSRSSSPPGQKSSRRSSKRLSSTGSPTKSSSGRRQSMSQHSDTNPFDVVITEAKPVVSTTTLWSKSSMATSPEDYIPRFVESPTQTQPKAPRTASRWSGSNNGNGSSDGANSPRSTVSPPPARPVYPILQELADEDDALAAAAEANGGVAAVKLF